MNSNKRTRVTPVIRLALTLPEARAVAAALRSMIELARPTKRLIALLDRIEVSVDQAEERTK